MFRMLLAVACVYWFAVITECLPAAVVVDKEELYIDERHEVDVEQALQKVQGRLAEVETSLVKISGQLKKICPPHFTYVPSVNGCYKVVTQNLDWYAAGHQCRAHHKDAHLVVIDNAAEQRAIASMVERVYKDVTSVTCNHGAQLLTAGHRVVPSSNSPFVWKVVSSDGRSTTVTYMQYSNWDANEPNFHLSSETCLAMKRYAVEMKWNDVPCSLEFCSVCEIDLE